MKDISRIFLFVGLLCLAFLLWKSGWLNLLSIENLRSRHAELLAWADANFVMAIVYYTLIYVAVTALALPGAAVMTLAGGAIFGLVTGTVIVSFASTIGATLCFLGSRILLRDWVTTKFQSYYQSVERGLSKDGIFYLFSLRLIPLVPFFVVNLVFGLTRISAGRFFIVSQVGMLPGTIAYVNAGTQLSQISSGSGIFSFRVMVSFAILALLPWIGKLVVNALRRRRIYKPYMKPSSFDYDVIVIGGGAAGLVSSYVSAALKAKVALIEKHRMGGDCLYTGCVPSKALIRSAHIAQNFRRGSEFGLQAVAPQVDFQKIFRRVQDVIQKIEPNDSVERYTDLGVKCIADQARIADPFRVKTKDGTLTTRNIIVATGARPFVPEIPGLKDVPFYTSDTLWELKAQPKRLLIMGGGAIGCELAQAFARLGCSVNLIERGDRLMAKEDPEVSSLITSIFEKEGITVHLKCEADRFEKTETGGRVVLKNYQVFDFDAVILALGRKPSTSGLGLEELGIGFRKDGSIETDGCLRTRVPNIFAVGDVTGPFQFTHAASHQAGYAVLNALFSPFKSFAVDYSAMPWCTFVDPEVARLGINETEAHQREIAFDSYVYHLEHLDRAICEGEGSGFVKVLTEKGGGSILGVTIVAARAGEMIAEFALAKRKRLSLNEIMNTVHAYPTYMEANRFAAGLWKRQTAPAWGLRFLTRFHSWRRG